MIANCTITADEIRSRLSRFQDAVRAMELDGAILLQRADLVWASGAVFQGALVIPAQGESSLFCWKSLRRTERRWPYRCIALSGSGKFAESVAAAGLSNWKRVGYEEDVLPVSWFKRFVEASWPHATFSDISMQLRGLRSIKSPAELNLIRQSGQVLAKGFEKMRELIREGEREYELEANLESALRCFGDQGTIRIRSFNAEARGLVIAGESAGVECIFDSPLAQPGRYDLTPIGPGDKKIQRDEPVIVDTAAGVHGYMADMTRTYYIGKLGARFIEAHDFCVHILNEVERKMRPGAIPEDLYNWAAAEAAAAGYGEYFMNHGQNQVRFLGHGIGIELDEVPIIARRFADPLQEGMVLAIEPKIIFPEGAVGVEDTFVIEADGCEAVTPMQRGLIEVD